MSPATWSFEEGLVVPIPTLPSLVIVINSLFQVPLVFAVSPNPTLDTLPSDVPMPK